MGLRERRAEIVDQKATAKERRADPDRRWEYKVLHIREGRSEGMGGVTGLERQFNMLGHTGWELTAYVGERAVFKRAIERPVAPA